MSVKTSHDNRLLRTCQTLCTTLCQTIVLAGCSGVEPITTTVQSTSEIRGTVTDCFGAEVISRKNLPVHVYPFNESTEIRKKLDELEKLHDVKESQKLLFEVLNLVTRRGSSIPPTKTNNEGHFSFQNLRPGVRYLIIAADVDYDDFLKYGLTKELKTGTQEVPILGPKTKVECSNP